MKLNFLDRALSEIAPAYALKRARSKMAFNALDKALVRGFDGAKKGRRLGPWGASMKSANQDISVDRETLIARSRDLEQNDPYAKGGADALVSNVVGDGIIPTPYIFNETNDTPEALKKKLLAFDNKLEAWADTSKCDNMDQTSLYGLQGLIFRTIVNSGMCFVVKVVDPANKALPLRLKLLEPDFLDVNKNENSDTRIIFRGIEISKKTSRVVAYWFLTEHPDGGIGGDKADSDSVRMKVEDVLAPFNLLRPGQLIGIPWLYAGMTRLHEFSKYEDAQLVKQQVSALTVTYIQRALDTDLPEGEEEAEKYYESREPGGHIYLNPGETAEEANPPSVDGYSTFSQNTLRGVARVFGLTYEELTQDYSNVNFSSARMGWVSMNRNIKMWRTHMLNPMLLDKLSDWIIEAAQISLGDLSFVRMKWTSPRREMIDLSKEISANAVALSTGQTTLTEIYTESGRDFKKAMRERKEEIELLDSLGIKIEGINLNINISNSEDDNATGKSKNNS